MKREKHCKCPFHIYHGCYWFGKVFEWSIIYWHFIKQHQSDTFLKRVFKNFAKFKGDHLYRSLFFNKVAGYTANKKEIALQKFSKNTFFTEHPRSTVSIYSRSQVTILSSMLNFISIFSSFLYSLTRNVQSFKYCEVKTKTLTMLLILIQINMTASFKYQRKWW